MKINFTAVIVFTLASTLSHAASFDCKKASNFVEKTICNDSRLNKLDDVLSENYQNISTSNIGDGARKDLKATQRAWLAVRNKCTDSECLTNSYKQRIDKVCDYPVITGVHPGCTSYEDDESELKIQNEKQSVNDNTNQKTAPAQASIDKPQKAELEKAWACKPAIIRQFEGDAVIFYNSSCTPENTYYPTNLRFSMPAESQILAELLLKTYHVNLGDKNTYNEFNQESESWKQRQQVKESLVKQEANEHGRKLRSGEIKIASMGDALKAYPDDNILLKTASSPLLTPDMTTMTGYVVIDAQEKPGFIRAKATTAMAIYLGQGGSEHAYVYLQLTKKSKNFAPDKLRIGGNSIVIGKYVKNVQYNTIDGQEKTAPVIEVMYMNQN